MTAYAELQVTTNFTFRTGASHPEELAARAAALGHAAIAATDRNTLAGVVRLHMGARAAGIRAVIGARLDFADAPSLLCFPTDRAAYGRLARLITTGRRRAPKGECRLLRRDLDATAEGQLFAILPPGDPDDGFIIFTRELSSLVPGNCYLAASHRYGGDDARRLARLADIAETAGIPLLATNDVLMHAPERRKLADVLSCIREHATVDTAGLLLAANAERHLKPGEEMARLFADHPDAVARTLELARRARFSLDELRYEYPGEPVPPGMTPDGHLACLARAGAAGRWPEGVPAKVAAQIEHELGLIAGLGFAPYFLTVHDIVRFARSQGILCQGRGSAANSAVCYCLGVTAVDPARLDLLFERFVSAERNEPPDIDIDFEHERREEVIQYVYEKYGRERAGLAATVISWRTRSAIREVGKALGLSEDTTAALAGQIWGWSNEAVPEAAVREAGLDPAEPRLAQALALARELTGFPRHLSQHVGGFVITRGRLDELCPVENAAMADRTVIEWDKDDLDALGILKIDLLGLGMLTCVRKAFDLLRVHRGLALDLATVPPEDEAVYDMLCRADSLGVFQVESRAQMAFLPRMKPRDFYDLVIEVAIVRPGPIQGDMVHPYLRRRNGEERVDFPKQELADVLQKTLGVPLFQEQAMRIAIVAAGFAPGEANGLRRAMATFRKTGTIHHFRDKMIEGMVERKYERDFAERCFRQIEGFGEYGFPESHAASFALLVYVSAWLKCRHPDVFAAALLNSQPMGFYAPAQIVRDARDHGVEVRRPDVSASDWDCTLEAAEPVPGVSSFDRLRMRTPGNAGVPPTSPSPPLTRRVPSLSAPGGGEGRGEVGESRYLPLPLRLGLRQVRGLSEAVAKALVKARDGGWQDVPDLWRRAGLGRAPLEALARADAFRSLGLDRRGALWAVAGLATEPAGGTAALPLFAAAAARGRAAGRDEKAPALPAEHAGEALASDYAALRLSLDHHPMALLREAMQVRRVIPAGSLVDLPDGKRVTVAGLVLVRQRPGNSGVIFMTLEDETGTANVIVWPKLFERFRRAVVGSRLALVHGTLQREGIVTHVVAGRILDASALLDGLAAGLGDGHPGHAPADEPSSGRNDASRLRPGRYRPALPNPACHPREVVIPIDSHDFH